jgi:mannose-6-phosphate isomerase-like protein (cupin superfamily)
MMAADPVALLTAIESTPAQRFAVAFTCGSVSVEMYAPQTRDLQRPHDQDELYVVYRGTGDFCVDDERQRFAAGSVFFVPAGVAHRFEHFSEDFATWAIFCGPRGGERSGGDG